jgi:hypothetical protein
MGRALHVRLKAAYEAWKGARDDCILVDEVAIMANQFGKERSPAGTGMQLRREDLELICFEYVTG